MITRRGLFGLLPALGVAAIPSSASAEPAIQPIILEHTCDAGKSRYSPDGVREAKAHGRTYWGCGTTFQWYFGVSPYCPKCGYPYDAHLELLRTGIYRVVQGRLPK